MGFPLPFARQPAAGRPTLRQRLHKAVAKVRDRISHRDRKGGGTDASRRALMVGTLAATMAPGAALARDPLADGELFRLLDAYEAALVQHEEIQGRCWAATEACLQVGEDLVPYPDGATCKAWTDEERSAFRDRRHNAIMGHYFASPELRQPSEEEARFWDEVLTPLARQIAASRAETLGGIGRKAAFLLDHGGGALGLWIDIETDKDLAALHAFVSEVADLIQPEH